MKRAKEILDKGTLVEVWNNRIRTKGKTTRFISGREYLIRFNRNYYSIFVSDKNKVQKTHSQRLVREKQVGEFSYRGIAILLWEGLLEKKELIGEGLV